MSKRIENILIRRDWDTRAEAKARIKEVKQLMEECNYDPVETENIVAEYLGLELDYIIDLVIER